MKIHYLQHVPFEDLANIADWAEDKGHELSRTLLYEDEALPGLNLFDWLIIMGGPMSTNEEKKYPWLKKEKRFILDAISNDKVVLGICLGAQLIADVLGAKVYKNRFPEIGWHQVTLTPDAKGSTLFCNLPPDFMAFHWHGDTFDIPIGGLWLAESEGCKNQAFEYRGKVVGLQFHLESSVSSIIKLIDNCGEDMVDGKYIDSSKNILNAKENVNQINNVMTTILNNIESGSGGKPI